jgi:hypothetical protein
VDLSWLYQVLTVSHEKLSGRAAGPTPGGILKRRVLDAAQTAHGELGETMGSHPADPA